MKCIKCSKKANVKVQNLNSCENCFLDIIQKRVRKELRINKLIRKNDKILIIDDGSPEFYINDYLLKNIIKGLPVVIKIKKLKYVLGKEVKGNFNKIIIPWNADKEDEYFLGCVFENQKTPYLGHFKLREKNYIKLLLPVLRSEIEEFAKIKKFAINKQVKTYVSEMMDQLETEYPEIKFSLLKSSKQIYK